MNSSTATVIEFPDNRWRRMLRKFQGQVLPSPSNAQLIVTFDPVLKGLFAYDKVSRRVIVLRPPPTILPRHCWLPLRDYPRPLDATDKSLILDYVRRYNPKFGPSRVRLAIYLEAIENAYEASRA